MNNDIKSLLNKIDYNTYNNIRNNLLITNVAAPVINLTVFSQFPVLHTIITGAICSALAIQIYLSFSNDEIYIKDITEIRDLYNEFIKQFNMLNIVFQFNNPIQIYTMYNYLLYHGYLSKDKMFEFSKENVKDIKSIMGTNVINGKGVCRHISSLLTDILNDYGMQSSNMRCYLRKEIFDFNIVKEQVFTREELNQFANTYITNEKERNLLFRIIEYAEINGEYVDLSYKYKNHKDILKILFGNHLITYTKYNNNNYFLDPTQNRIYRLKKFKEKNLI